MKIAVPVTLDKYIDSHFGHCESYGVYTISENNEITDIKTIQSAQGCGCSSQQHDAHHEHSHAHGHQCGNN